MKRLTSEERLTDVELEAIRKRAEAATEGPWIIGRKSPNGLNNIGTMGGLLTAQTLIEEDATFIASARTDIPKLLAEIDCLRDSVEMSKRIVSGLTRENAILKGEKPITVHLNGGDDLEHDEGEPPSDMCESGVSISEFKTAWIEGGASE